jgi:hypothetical protein
VKYDDWPRYADVDIDDPRRPGIEHYGKCPV